MTKIQEILERGLEEYLEKNKTMGYNGVRIDIWTHLTRECIINYVH